MAAPPIPIAKQKAIRKLHAQGLSHRAIGRKLGIDHTLCVDYLHKPETAPKTPEEMEAKIRKDLRRGPMSPDELGEGLGAGPGAVRKLLAGMKARGVLLVEHPNGLFEMASTVNLAPGVFELKAKPGVQQVYGVTGDNHLCSKYERLDVLNAAYDEFARSGVRHVFNTGNWIDGEARFNKTELLTPPGMDHQLDYMIRNYPARAGITTHYVAGDDHEGWYAQREGIEIGRYLESRAHAAGRKDLHYLGYAEADVMLKCGTGASVCRVVHPGGGSAYALSYTVQKLVESYQGGEKPHVLLAGHYHKAEYCYAREVHCLQTACTTDQSLFMRKKKLAAHVGFWKIWITQDTRGVITSFGQQFFPYYDRGFYERRYR